MSVVAFPLQIWFHFAWSRYRTRHVQQPHHNSYFQPLTATPATGRRQTAKNLPRLPVPLKCNVISYPLISYAQIDGKMCGRLTRLPLKKIVLAGSRERNENSRRGSLTWHTFQHKAPTDNVSSCWNAEKYVTLDWISLYFGPRQRLDDFHSGKTITFWRAKRCIKTRGTLHPHWLKNKMSSCHDALVLFKTVCGDLAGIPSFLPSSLP